MHLLWNIRTSLYLFLGAAGVNVFLVEVIPYYVDAKVYDVFVKNVLEVG